MIYYRGRWLIEPEIKALLDKLEDLNKELRSEADRVLRENTVLREKQEFDDRQIAECKRLLKEAVEGYSFIGHITKDYACPSATSCSACPMDEGKQCRIWEHADEALALIGKDIDVPATEDDTNVGHKSGGWISCKDRLPSENTLVLCYARSKTGEGNGYFLGALAHGEFWFLKVNDIGHVSCPVLHWEVTHWQPLPEPPKED